MNKVKSGGEIFGHPVRTKLYLYVKAKKEICGIRETQRAIGATNPSTVQWHLDKLVEAGYVLKNGSNTYLINPEKNAAVKIGVDIRFTAFLYREILVSPLIFLLSFLIFMFVLSMVFLSFRKYPLFIALQGFVSLFVSILVVGYLFIKIQLSLRKLS